MTSQIVTALTNKIENLFCPPPSGDQKTQLFLSFIIPGLPISAREFGNESLSTTSTARELQEALEAYASFSRLVNKIPNVSKNWHSDGTILWDEYNKILNQAILASSEATADEIKQLEQARNFVNERETAYKQYQLVYELACSRYKTLKLSVENSDELESRYKREMNEAYDNWVNKGYKNQVEQAYSTIDQLSKRSPILFFRQLNQNFRDCRYFSPKQEYYETQFYPVNFYKSDGQNQWMRLVVDSRDIEQVSLEQTGNNPGLDITVSRLEFELTRVEILRPWMNPSLFKERFWQLPDGHLPLSDGEERPQGSLPAYATSMVLIRNLKIQAQSANIQPDQLSNLGPLSLQNATVSASNLIQSEGMQIIAFICQKLPKSPNPDPTLAWSGRMVVNWFSGKLSLDRNAKISQVKVTIRTGGDSGAGTDSYVYFRVNNGHWWELDKPSYNDFEANQTDTYGPFDTSDANLRVENLSVVPIELKLEKYLWDVAPAWQVAWLRLEVNVEGKGWLTYKEWQPGWLDPSAGTNFKQLQ